MSPWTEIIGYAGSVLVAISLMMSSLARLRWINLAGALAFAVYGWIVGAYPVLAVNGFIVLVNIYYLRKMSRTRDYFSLMPIRRRDNKYLQTFLAFHEADIGRFFPEFSLDSVGSPRMTFILRNVNPAGLVVYEEDGDEVRIHLDYVLPSYRDLRCARFFLDEMAPIWREQGMKKLLSPAAGAMHRDYLKRLGFRRGELADRPIFERSLD
ncbi:MAG: hypothetical protein ABFS42_02795 [Candidatus Krumholzibacteriota bacterium]